MTGKIPEVRRRWIMEKDFKSLPEPLKKLVEGEGDLEIRKEEKERKKQPGPK